MLGRGALVALTVASLVGFVGAGVASGSSVANRSFKLVALGDSIPYASDCGGCTGYVVLYARAASKALGRPVSVDNRAEHNDLSSAMLLSEIRQSPSLRSALRGADIITLTVGHNDTPWVVNDDACDGAASDTDNTAAIAWKKYASACSLALASQLRTNVSGIIAQIRQLRGGKPTLIRVTNFHNDNMGDPTVPRAADAPTKFVVDAFSKAICGAAASAHVPCADIYHAFNGRAGTTFDGSLVSDDHVHPNQAGYALIARLLAKLGYVPLKR